MSVQKVDIILLAGGKGTRFLEVTRDKIPKSLYKLNEVELMKYSLRNLDFALVGKLIFALGYHAEGVRAWVESQAFPCEVVFSYQQEPGILGAVRSAQDIITTESFVVCNTDEIREGFFLGDLLAEHIAHVSALATMAVTRTNNLHHHRSLTLDDKGKVTTTKLKDPYYKDHPDMVGYANVGFIVFRTGASAYFDAAYGNDWSAIINPLVEIKGLQAFVNPNIQYFNVGTLSELEEASEYVTTHKFKPILAST